MAKFLVSTSFATAVIILVASLTNFAAGEVQFIPSDYEYSFSAPAIVSGNPGEFVVFEAVVQLSKALEAVQGWSISTVTDNPALYPVVYATTSDTVGADVGDNPPGLRSSGFEKTEIGYLDEADTLPGAISAVVLSFIKPITLDPEDAPHDLLRFGVLAQIPIDGSEKIVRLQFVNGLQGSGQPVSNAATAYGGTVQLFLSDGHVILSPITTSRGITIDAGDGGVEVGESGLIDTFTIVLDSSPSNGVLGRADVVVLMADGSDPNQVYIEPEQVIFTDDNWSVPQTVTVIAIDDDVVETHPHHTTIRYVVSSDNPFYDGRPVTGTVVSIRENECGALGFPPFDLDKNCRVDWRDFAMLASSWLDCSIPDEAGCVNYSLGLP